MTRLSTSFSRAPIWTGIFLLSCWLVSPWTNAEILILNSDRNIPRYGDVESGFVRSIKNTAIHQLDLGQEKQPVDAIQDALNHREYQLILTIGAKSLGAIDYLAPDMPVVFTSVLNWKHYAHQKGFYGLTSNLSPKAQLSWIRLIFSNVKRVGVVYSAENTDMIKQAELAAEKLGLKIVSTQVESSAHARQRIAGILSKVDLLWVIPAPTVLSSQTHTRELFALAQTAKVPVFAYHKVFLKLGATLTATADQQTVGRQAALIASGLLHGKTDIQRIQPPAGSSLTLNMSKVKELKLQLNEAALRSVQHIVYE